MKYVPIGNKWTYQVLERNTNLRHKILEAKSAVEQTLVGHVQHCLLNDVEGRVQPVLSFIAGDASRAST